MIKQTSKQTLQMRAYNMRRKHHFCTVCLEFTEVAPVHVDFGTGRLHPRTTCVVGADFLRIRRSGGVRDLGRTNATITRPNIRWRVVFFLTAFCAPFSPSLILLDIAVPARPNRFIAIYRFISFI